MRNAQLLMSHDDSAHGKCNWVVSFIYSVKCTQKALNISSRDGTVLQYTFYQRCQGCARMISGIKRVEISRDGLSARVASATSSKMSEHSTRFT